MGRFQPGLWSNAGRLLSGNVAGSLVGVAVVAISARALDPVQFGQLSMFAAGYQLSARLAVVQTGNAFIKFGAGRLGDDPSASMSELSTALALWCLRLEWGTALLGAGLYVLALLVVPSLIGQPSGVAAGLMFVMPLLINVGSFAAGVLRLGGEFGYVAIHPVISNLAKLAGCAFLWISDSSLGLVGFAAAWAFGDFVGLAFLGMTAFLVSRGRTWVRRSAEELPVPIAYPGLRRFIVTGVAHNAVKSLVRDGDVLLIGSLGGAPAAGAYRIVKQIGSVLGRIVEPLQQAMFPDMARLAARGARREIRRTLTNIAVVTAVAFTALWLGFALVGRPLIDVVLGAEYGGVYVPTLVFLAGTALSMAGVGLHPAALALGVPLESFRVLVVSSICYGVGLLVLVPGLGVLGAAIAYVGFYGLWVVQLAFRLRRYMPQ